MVRGGVFIYSGSEGKQDKNLCLQMISRLRLGRGWGFRYFPDMSLFEELGKKILGNVLSGQGGQGGGDLIHVLMKLLEDAGGLQALLAKFQQAGLGEQVASWIGNGSNLPMSGAQVKKALGSILTQLSGQTGLNENLLAQGVAKLLPGLISDLSPDGQQVDEGALPEKLQQLLSSGPGKWFA